MNNVNLYNAAGEVIETYTNVVEYGADFVEYRERENRVRYYCDATVGEYFEEVPPEVDGDEATEEDYINALSELGVQLNEED